MNLQNITTYLQNKFPESPESVVILGSGLGDFTENLKSPMKISYGDVPDYPHSSVEGHKGEWVFGYINETPIICANGRFHYYEGYSMEEVALPVTVGHNLDCKTIFITNAAGCLNKNWQLGDLMLINGFMDYSFRNNSNPPKTVKINIDSKILSKIKQSADILKITLREGIYTWTLGPTYETPAEIMEIIKLGGCAVGMSTVPELMKARELELNIIGISCLTNYGAGMEKTKLTHEDVLLGSKQVQEKFSKLLLEII